MTDATLIGVLALQGAFREHRRSLERLGVASREVRLPRDLDGLDGLIMPGGESTTIGKLLVEWQLIEPLRQLGTQGLPIWGTCAGAIMLADVIEERGRVMDQPRLGLLPMTAVRNAFGRQRESFEADIPIAGLEDTYRAVFIRAPMMIPHDAAVEVLATVEDQVVFVRYKNLVASSFHPELTEDDRIHRYFVNLAKTCR
jgi:5'-phosphate synthase pdxT subunit